MKTCPACRKRIDVRATRCPHCIAAFDAMQMEEGRKEHSRHRLTSVVAGIIVATLAVYATADWLSGGGVEWLANY